MKAIDIFKENSLNALNIVALALPISIGYGVLSGLGPISGVIGLFFSLLLGSFFGGIQGLIRTPTAVTTLVIAFALNEMENSIIEKTQIAIFIFILAGIFLILIGKFNLAKYIKLMPYPLIKGITISIGILLISKSVFKIIDFKNINSIDNLFPLSIVLSVIFIGIILEKINKKIPAIFFSIALPSFVCYFFDYQYQAIEYQIIGGIEFISFNTISSIPLNLFIHYLPTAIFVALYAALSSSLCALILDDLTEKKYRLNKENVDLGIINIVSGIFGGIPSCGNIPVSLININSNHLSKYIGIYASIILLLFTLVFSSLLSYIPSIVIDGILIFLGFKLIDFKLLKSSFNIKNTDNLVLLTTLIVGVFGSLFHAIIAGFSLASLFFMYKMSKMSVNSTVSGDVDDLIKKNNVSEALKQRVRIINLNGPFFFGSAEDFYNRFDNLTNNTIIIVNLKLVPFTDDTGLNVIKKSINKALKSGVQIFFTGANPSIYKQFEKEGIVNDNLTENAFFPSVKSCLKMLKFSSEE